MAVADETPEDDVLVTVAVLTYNGDRYLRDLLKAVFAQRLDGAFEVLVIDSGSTDDTLAIVAQFPRVRLVQIPNSEFGHGRTRNLAAHLAKGRFVAYLTHDAVPESKTWLYELLKPFDISPRVAAVMGSQSPRWNCVPLLKYEIRSVFAGFGPRFGTSLFYDDAFIQSDAVRHAVTFYSDVNSAARRDLLTAGLPYRDVSYAEDQLLGMDLIEAGYVKAYAPRAAVVHSNDLSLREYDERLEAETRGQREVGIDVAVPGISVVARMVLVGVIKDSVRIVRDRQYSRRMKLRYLVVNPLFHVQKWRGVRRGARSPIGRPPGRSGVVDRATPDGVVVDD